MQVFPIEELATRRLDRELLSGEAAVMERHLRRVAERLPSNSEEFRPLTDAADSVILHLWQAIQTVIDLAVSACIHFNLGAPQNNVEAFQRLSGSGRLELGLAARLTLAAELPDLIAQDKIEMGWVYRTAQECPQDLRAFLAALESRL